MYHVVYQRLKQAALTQETAQYDELMQLARLDPFDRAQWARLWRILEQIDRSEHRHGRPLLSAVAVSKCGGIPGGGFFQLARALGRHSGSSDVRFWQEERARVHAAWRGKAP